MARVAVLGAGAGGHAYSADLKLIGHIVSLFELPEFKDNLKPILEKGGIEILPDQCNPKYNDVCEKPDRHGLAKIDVVTTDIKEAISGAEVIFNPIPARYYEEFAERCIPHLEDGQIVVTAGKGGGALHYALTMKRLGIKKDVLFGEFNTLGYCATVMGRILGEEYSNKVRIEQASRHPMIGTFPGKNASKVHNAVSSLYPEGTRNFRCIDNVMKTILMDYNAITHTPTIVCNAGRIESGDRTFQMFGDTCTSSVCMMMDELDKERMGIERALGFKAVPLVVDTEGPPDMTMYESVHQPFLELCEGPFSLKTRYLTEDVPYGLVTYSSLGDMLKVPTPVSDAIITIASVLNEEDYWGIGRTVEKLGINPSWTVEQLNKFLYEGEL
jgi:opine dehydrogenase